MTYRTKDLPILTLETADGRARDLLSQAKEKLGFVPTMYGAMANLPALFAAYASGYDAFRSDADFTPVEQEIIFLAISRENACPYCMAAHSFVADKMSGVPTEITDAIRADQPIPDEELESLRKFTATMVESRGRPTDADVAEFKEAGYSDKHILGIILAISVKTLSNYTNHIFHTPVDEVFASREWDPK